MNEARVSPDAFDIAPLTGALGAEVSGIDLARPLGHDVAAEVRRALDQHLVLFFRDQRLTPLQLRAFVSGFGPLFLHPEVEGVAEAPEVIELRKEPDGDRLFGGEGWHGDLTWLNPAGYVSALHGIEVPEVGGDTCFANLILAFECLSAGMKDLLRGMRAVHAYPLARPYSGRYEPQLRVRGNGALAAVHPVVAIRRPAGKGSISTRCSSSTSRA